MSFYYKNDMCVGCPERVLIQSKNKTDPEGTVCQQIMQVYENASYAGSTFS